MRIYIKAVSLLAIGVCAGLLAWFSIFGPARSAASQENSKRPILTKLPPIKNCLEHVKLVKAELLMWGDSQVASLEHQK